MWSRLLSKADERVAELADASAPHGPIELPEAATDVDGPAEELVEDHGPRSGEGARP